MEISPNFTSIYHSKKQGQLSRISLRQKQTTYRFTLSSLLCSFQQPHKPRAVIALHTDKRQIAKTAEHRSYNPRTPCAVPKAQQNGKKTEKCAHLVNDFITARRLHNIKQRSVFNRIACRVTRGQAFLPSADTQFFVKRFFKRFFRKPYIFKIIAVLYKMCHGKAHSDMVKQHAERECKRSENCPSRYTAANEI